MPTVANINDRLVNESPTVIARYTPQASGLFAVMLYLRVLAPVSMLLCTLDWADASGAQSQLLTGGGYDTGSYTVRATDIAATTAQDITVTVETDVTAAVRVSVIMKDQ